MTTIYLAKKFMSSRFRKVESEKIQYLRNQNMREMAVTKTLLKQVLTKYRAIKSCRLCLKLAENNIFVIKAGLNFAEDIMNILNIEVRQNDGKPQYICTECETILCRAVELRQIAQITQWRLAQEAEILLESACDDNGDNADDGINNDEHEDIKNDEDDEEVIIYQDPAKCKENRKIPNTNNDCSCCPKNTNKPNVNKKKRKQRFLRGSYICETCGMELKELWRLRVHMKTHSNVFNYSCEYCPYRTNSVAAIRLHERRHNGHRPYICEHCDRAFISSSSLASHRRTHLPPSLKCEFCQRGFKCKKALLNHIATQHRNAKPFCCSDCGNAFATRKMLLRHELKVHNRPKMRIGAIPKYIKSQVEKNGKTQDELYRKNIIR